MRQHGTHATPQVNRSARVLRSLAAVATVSATLVGVATLRGTSAVASFAISRSIRRSR